MSVVLLPDAETPVLEVESEDMLLEAVLTSLVTLADVLEPEALETADCVVVGISTRTSPLTVPEAETIVVVVACAP